MKILQQNFKKLDAKDQKIVTLRKSLDEQSKAIEDAMKRKDDQVKAMKIEYVQQENQMWLEASRKNDMLIENHNRFVALRNRINSQQEMINEMRANRQGDRWRHIHLTSMWDPTNWEWD